MVKSEFLANYDITTGHDLIDNQHIGLIDLIDFLEVGLRENSFLNSRELGDIIHDLFIYCRNHFRTEEHYMKEVGYPHFDEHVRMHQAFEERILEFQKRFYEKENDLQRIVYEYLFKWLKNHILIEDMKIFNCAELNVD